MAQATVIDGKAFAAKLREKVTGVVTKIKSDNGITPGLAVVLVGEDPASKVYVGSKAKQTVECGMESFEHRFDESIDEATLLTLIDTLNKDSKVNGILVQLPLPKQIDEQKVLSTISPDKDVDGFHTTNVGRLWTGGEALVPCTPFGCSVLLKDFLGNLSGKNAIVIGRSNIVGKPMAALLLAESCTVTIAHSRTDDLPGKCREADIVIAAVGRPEMIKGDWIKPGATVIDVGINRVEAPEKGLKEDGSPKTKLVGDVDYAEASQVAGAITPVPGGVGPMTIACLLRNTVVACCRQNGLADPGI
ncbi:MAG: bifunctional methylenetetrahydrofolate dehydrogenase/methenyltetrahydrofolate cyclohydrolase FolD [Rhodospirillales bacterium]|nr:bifunctional methylenetetrahydrofolate dehydrogenase/methenyltetrahydrofolate cyclohydrolase FolD [Rhodospirillales bacterium]